MRQPNQFPSPKSFEQQKESATKPSGEESKVPVPAMNSFYPPPYPYPMFPPQVYHEPYRDFQYPNFGSFHRYQQLPFAPQMQGPVLPPPPSHASLDRNSTELVKGLAMLGKLFDLSNDEKPRKSPERKKKIAKEEREIRLGNIIFRPSRGDWQCLERNCMNWNYAKREKCNKCGRYKEATRSGPPKEYRPVPAKRFWNCPGCKFDNYEHKESCFKCGDSKPEEKVSNDTLKPNQ